MCIQYKYQFYQKSKIEPCLSFGELAMLGSFTIEAVMVENGFRDHLKINKNFILIKKLYTNFFVSVVFYVDILVL